MEMQAYIDEIRLAVTGGVLELEITDDTLVKIVNAAMREVQRYICSTKLITVPYKTAIDLTEYKVNSVARVYRATASGAPNTQGYGDPNYMGLLQITSNYGSTFNFNDYAARMGAWSTVQQIANTLSTDLAYYYDDARKMLYINTTLRDAEQVTIEYVPRYDNVEEITSDFWIDVLMRLSKAMTKITLGRIRSRYKASGALWEQDGDTLLTEGNSELAELRTYMQNNTQLFYLYD